MLVLELMKHFVMSLMEIAWIMLLHSKHSDMLVTMKRVVLLFYIFLDYILHDVEAQGIYQWKILTFATN